MQHAPRRPRVLYTTPIFGYPPYGGPRLRTLTTLRAVASAAEVVLHLQAPPDAPDPAAARAYVLGFCKDAIWPEPPRPPRNGRVGTAARRVLPGGLRRLAARALGRSGPPPAVSAGRDPAVLAELTALVRERDIDVVWLGFGGISYDLLALKEMTGRPVVLETESVWSRFLLRELPFTRDPERREAIRREGAAKEAEERWGAQLADVTTAVSEVDASYFRALAPDPSRVVLLPNVVDVAAYADADADAETGAIAEPDPPLALPSVLFTGTLSAGTANVDAAKWLLDAVMPLVWDRLPAAHVYLVGRSPAPALRRRRGPRVHLLADVPAILPYLRHASVSVVPLRWESGTRFKILEAFAAGSPVVSTTLGAEGLDVRAGEHLLLADDPVAFADAIVSVVADPGTRDRLRRAGARLVRERYDLAAAEQGARAALARVGVPVPALVPGGAADAASAGA